MMVNMSFSKPVLRSTPSQCLPGLMLYLFPGGPRLRLIQLWAGTSCGMTKPAFFIRFCNAAGMMDASTAGRFFTRWAIGSPNRSRCLKCSSTSSLCTQQILKPGQVKCCPQHALLTSHCWFASAKMPRMHLDCTDHGNKSTVHPTAAHSAAHLRLAKGFAASACNCCLLSSASRFCAMPPPHSGVSATGFLDAACWALSSSSVTRLPCLSR